MANRLLLFVLFVAYALIILPQPKSWVHFDDSCKTNYDDGQSWVALVLPSIVTRTNIIWDHLHAVVVGRVCATILLCTGVFLPQ